MVHKPTQYLLTTDQGTTKVSIVQSGVAEFDDLYPGQYFEVNSDAYQLAKAFMARPSYLGQEPVVAKMVHSGLLSVVEGNSTYCLDVPGRIRKVALIFFNANIQKIKKTSNLPETIMRLAFYYYGEEIQMNLYKGNIEIKDATSDNWYELNPKDITQISASLSAS